MLGDLFAFNEAYLAPGRRSSFAAHPAEIAGLAGNALAGDEFDFADGLQRCAGFDGVQVQRGNPGG